MASTSNLHTLAATNVCEVRDAHSIFALPAQILWISSTSMSSSSSSSLSCSSEAEQVKQDQPTSTTSISPLAGAQACLQALRNASVFLPKHQQAMHELLEAIVLWEGEREARGAKENMLILRHYLGEVFGDKESRRCERWDITKPPQDYQSRRNRGRTDLTINTATIAARSSSNCGEVLHTPLLVSSIIGWFVHKDQPAPSRVALGQTALINKEWRHISRQDCFWRPLVGKLLPVLEEKEEKWVYDRGYDGYLCHYGFCLTEKEVLTGDNALFDGLEMQMEVFNAATVPPARIYSALGPIRARLSPFEDDLYRGSTISLFISGPHRQEIAPAFSMVDLDPAHQRYSTIEDWFDTAHYDSNPLHLCMRVTVPDIRTGKVALVFDTNKNKKYRTAPLPQ